jgi:hypothetical protein
LQKNNGQCLAIPLIHKDFRLDEGNLIFFCTLNADGIRCDLRLAWLMILKTERDRTCATLRIDGIESAAFVASDLNTIAIAIGDESKSIDCRTFSRTAHPGEERNRTETVRRNMLFVVVDIIFFNIDENKFFET